MKATPVICGDCLILLSDCIHSADYLKEITSSAERLVQLTQEREKMK